MAENLMNMTVKGLEGVKRDLDAYSRKKDRAMASAIKVELFRLRGGLKAGVRSGSPGGNDLEKLTALARFRDGLFRGTLPFRGMSSAVKYEFDARRQVGRVGWTPSTSSRLRRIVQRTQEGFETPVTDKQRSLFARRGGMLGQRSRLRKFFFLKKTTKVLETPARQIVEPFYSSERGSIKQNIHRNFRLKMQGRRI